VESGQSCRIPLTRPKGHPLPIRWGEGRGEGGVRLRRSAASGRADTGIRLSHAARRCLSRGAHVAFPAGGRDCGGTNRRADRATVRGDSPRRRPGAVSARRHLAGPTRGLGAPAPQRHRQRAVRTRRASGAARERARHGAGGHDLDGVICEDRRRLHPGARLPGAGCSVPGFNRGHGAGRNRRSDVGGHRPHRA
jgi:hypothetical protein